MATRILTQEELKSQLHYDSNTGIFTWNTSRPSVKLGKLAGVLVSNSGYISIRIHNEMYMAHRLAWLYTHGDWPKQYIDHINGVRNDNRLCNLRECNTAENMRNIRKHSSNTSGYKGVDFNKQKQRFRARCRVDGKRYHIGLYDTAIEAHIAYQEFAKQHHGEFYRPT
jgi:hypothetical protein